MKPFMPRGSLPALPLTAMLLVAVAHHAAAQQNVPPPAYPTPPPAPSYAPVPPPYAYAGVYFGRFYVRADGWGAFSTDTRFKSEAAFAPNTILFPGERFLGGNGNSVIYDIGIGSRLLPWFRWDATLSYLPSLKFSGSDNFGAGTMETAQIRSLAGLLNLYIDFDGMFPYAFGPFQPYIDFGFGAASNRLGAFSSTLLGGTVDGNTHVSAAAAVGAGIGWRMTNSVVLDLAYRFLDLGTMKTGSTATIAGVPTSVQPLRANLQTSTVTLGLRVSFP